MRLHGWIAGFAALVVICASPSAFAEGRWLRAESPHFIVFSDLQQNTLRTEIETLERFDDLLRRLTRVQSPAADNKLIIYLVARRGTFREFAPRIGNDVAGFYRAGTREVGALAIQHQAGLPGREILFHEYAHHFMFQYFTGMYPGWYVEGFAEWVQTADFDDTSVTVGAFNDNRGAWLMDDDWVDIEDMLKPTAPRRNEEETAHFYAQSWLMTHYIFREPARGQAFAAYLTALNNGADPIAAFEPAFGFNPASFERQLHRYANGGLVSYRLANTPIQTEVSFTRLNEAADDLLPLLVRMRTGVPDDQRADITNGVNRVAARYPDDRLVHIALAEEALMRSDPAGARARLESLVQTGSSDEDALFLYGYSYFIEAQKGDASAWAQTAAQGRRYFARVFRLHASNVQTLYFYALSYLQDGTRLPPQVLDVLIEAHEQAPQVGGIALQTGTELMKAERWDEAIAALNMFARYAHGGDTANRALALLEAARHHQPPPAPTPETPDDQ